jgi:hypothetical protein
MKKTIVASLVALTMSLGGVGASAQVTDAIKGVGHATKEAGQAVVHGTKKAVGTTGHEMKEAVTPRAKCADGTRFTAKSQKAANAACNKHGGLAK